MGSKMTEKVELYCTYDDDHIADGVADSKHTNKLEPAVDELKIRYDEEERLYYVYLNGPFGSCAYQSDPFDTLAEAEAFKQEQEDSADFGE